MRHIGCRDFLGEPSNECTLATMPQNARLCVGSCDRKTKTQGNCISVISNDLKHMQNMQTSCFLFLFGIF